MARKIAAANAAIFFPWDHPWVVRRALRVFDPALVIVLETEIWPSFLRMARRRGIPVLLLSGRLSARSLRRYQLWGALFREVVRQFNALGMQTEGDGQRIAQVGAEPSKIWITGNLKFGAEGPLNGKQAQIPLPQNAIKRNCWVAGSTHRDEEDIVLDAHDILKVRFPGLGLVLAPRHPQRFLEVEALLQKRGLVYTKRSQMNGKNSWTTDVLLLDTMGELVDFYAQAAGAFVGGSLVKVGGHNILEPARLRKPVFFGPFMESFSAAAAEMESIGCDASHLRGVADGVEALEPTAPERGLLFKDAVLDELAHTANVAQFVSFDPRLAQRFCRIRGWDANHRFGSVREAAEDVHQPSPRAPRGSGTPSSRSKTSQLAPSAPMRTRATPGQAMRSPIRRRTRSASAVERRKPSGARSHGQPSTTAT